MRFDAETYCTLDAQSLLIYAPGFILEIDKRTGEWRQVVARHNGRNLVPPGGARTAFDLHVEGQWLSTTHAPRLIHWEQRLESEQFAVIMEIALGPFYGRQWIRTEPDGMGFQRSLELRYHGSSRATLRAVDLLLARVF